jgi:hypothetical protein
MSSSSAGRCGGLVGRFDNSVGLSQGGSESMGDISARSSSRMVAGSHFVNFLIRSQKGYGGKNPDKSYVGNREMN